MRSSEGPAASPITSCSSAGFPCFVAGTMVLTADGHVPIEDVKIGTLVLTHRGRWRPVTATMSRDAQATRRLRGHGFPDIVTTDEHPFWARRRSHVWHQGMRRYVRAFDDPSWLPAIRIDRSTFLSQVYPVDHLDAPVDLARSADFYWLVGRYLADGWRAVNNRKGRVVICSSIAEADEVEERIRRVYPCTRSAERTVVKFHITRREFHDWLQDFGRGAAGKRIPG